MTSPVPSSDPRPAAIVLGGTAPHISLICELRRRGWRTVLVDYLQAPPAAAHADLHVVETTLDAAKVEAVARAEGAKLVIATCVDQANVIACRVSEALGLPHPYPAATAALIANKRAMKAQMVKAGIPTARHIALTAADLQDLGAQVAGLRWPLVVKPADANGSAGVRRADDIAALSAYLPLALERSRVGEAVVEEFVTGDELTIDAFVTGGQAQIVLVRRKYPMVGVPAGKAIQSAGSIAPWPLPPHRQAEAEALIARLAAAFGLDNVPMIVQAFLTPAGLSVIEFSARLSGGTGAAVTPRISGVDPIVAALDSWLGQPVRIHPVPTGLWVTTTTLYARPGRLGRIEGIEGLVSAGTVETFLPYKTPGAEIGDDLSTRSRVGAFLVTGRSRDEAEARTRAALEQIEVFAENGTRLTLREIHSQLAVSAPA